MPYVVCRRPPVARYGKGHVQASRALRALYTKAGTAVVFSLFSLSPRSLIDHHGAGGEKGPAEVPSGPIFSNTVSAGVGASAALEFLRLSSMGRARPMAGSTAPAALTAATAPPGPRLRCCCCCCDARCSDIGAIPLSNSIANRNQRRSKVVGPGSADQTHPHPIHRQKLGLAPATD
jgi:hypothetical protein